MHAEMSLAEGVLQLVDTARREGAQRVKLVLKSAACRR